MFDFSLETKPRGKGDHVHYTATRYSYTMATKLVQVNMQALLCRKMSGSFSDFRVVCPFLVCFRRF